MNYERGFLRLYTVTMIGSFAFELWDIGYLDRALESWLPFGVALTAIYLCTRWAVGGFKR